MGHKHSSGRNSRSWTIARSDGARPRGLLRSAAVGKRSQKTLSDDEVLDFDMKPLGVLRRTPRELLDRYGDAYRLQLVAARCFEARAIGVESQIESPTTLSCQRERYEGMAEALRDVAAYLRKGDLLPGGILYENTLRQRLLKQNRTK